MDASDIYSERLNAKEVIFPKENGKCVFPVADGGIKLRWRRSGTENIHLNPGEPRPRRRTRKSSLFQDSSWYDGEARNDFWSIFGNYIYRHHFEPRVKLYVPREASFPIPLTYINATRSTSTSVDVMLEKCIDDCWNVDGDRDLSDTWTGFTRFTMLDENHRMHIHGLA